VVKRGPYHVCKTCRAQCNHPKIGVDEGVAIIAIFPIVFATGVGGEILAPMALPVLGGLLISDEVVDLFLPVRFYWVRRARWLKLHR
jgi:copper/silver efflux system protein